MADPNTRQGKRTPVTLKIKFKSETLEQFIERYAVDVSQGGIFIRTKEPLAVGTQMKFEFQLRDASPLIAGEGTVVWTRENDPSRPAIAPGMGVRFDRLADGSQAVLERILAEKAKQAPGRAGNEPATKPPMFTDTPTRVAPAPVQEALGVRQPRAKSDSEQTPLPPPRPFHSDADDFDERAFEEATKVRSLEELAAQTAGLAGLPASEDPAHDASDDAPTNTAISMPPDELAARRKNERADSTLSEPPESSSTDTTGDKPAAAAASAATIPSERESAPGLPEPPSHPGDSTPPANKPSDGPKTKLGVEPAKAETRAKSDSAAPRAVPAEASIPVAPQRSSAASVIILLLVLVAGAAAAVWWFVLREDVAREVAQQQDEGSGSAVATNPEGSGSATGSDISATGSDGSAAGMVPDGSGSATAMVQDGSGSGSAGSATETVPAAVVDTVITASLPKNAMVEIAGTDQKGAAPLVAKLEKDKAYTAKVSAPGFVTKEIEIKGGQAKVTAKLAPKQRIITITTDPPGAAIYIDGVDTERISPADVQLTASQALRPRVRVSLRRPGFRPVDQILDVKKFQESDARMTASINAKLAVAQRPTGTDAGTNGGSGHTGSGSAAGSGGSGSATTPGGDTGSESTPSGGGTGGSGTTAPSGGGTSAPSGGATTAPGAGASNTPSSTATPTASNGEPEPTWAK